MKNPQRVGTSVRRNNRVRAVLLDVFTIVASIPAAYVHALSKGSVESFEEFALSLRFTVPCALLLVIGRRFLQARARGKAEEYDYAAMNPKGFFKASDLPSPVPHIAWERHPGREAFFEAVVDRARFNDTPGFAIDVCRPGRPGEFMDLIRWFRSAATSWEEHGDAVHAVFDAPPLDANQWTADFGARMWASVVEESPGVCRVRVVFGSGGFGQGQRAAVPVAAAGNLPGTGIPVALTGIALSIERELRGAAGWWILFGQRLGVGEEEFSSVAGARLQVATVTGLVKSVDVGVVLKVVGAVAFVLLVVIPVLAALILG